MHIKALAIGMVYSTPIIGFIAATSVTFKTLKYIGFSYSLLAPIASAFLLEKDISSKVKRLQKIVEANERLLADKSYESSVLESDINTLKTDFNNQLASIKKDCDKQITAIKSQQNILLKTANEKVSQLEAERVGLIIRHKEEVNKLETLVANWQKREKELVSYSTKLTEKENDLKRGLKDFELERKSLELDRKNLENHLESQRVQFDFALSQSESAIGELQHQIEALNDENINLRQQVTILSNELSKPENQTARVILELFSQNKIRVDYLESTNSNGVWKHIYKPQSSNFNECLKSISEQLPGLIDIDSPPNYTVRNGKVTFLIDSRKDIDRVKFAPDNWLEKLALADENCLILGARGTGKSELAVNYCALLFSLRNDFSIKFIQPKPDEFSKIDLGDRIITPDYLGFEGSRYPTAYDGLLELDSIVMERNRVNTDNFENPPNWEPQFWIIDEFQQLIFRADSFGHKSKDISMIIKNAVSLGRSLKIYVLAIGQVANVSQFPGWNKADFHQFNQVYLGDSIKVGIPYLAIDRGEESALNSDFKSISNSPIKYYGLCYQDSKKFFAQLPKPREYCRHNKPQNPTQSATIESTYLPLPQPPKTLPGDGYSESMSVEVSATTAKKPGLLESVVCGNCESINVRKNGKYKGKQRYRCNDCGSSFSL
ncbi:IS1/IS1595 family N-terminal zinc-binding domain-containing protein [Laspinema olomoucense]|uniref:IS1/IS1595 family N-terminal zinc-binding domain-containing protein n=1 Tax=Laspinema olomoucense TaxID=3231600 RepID=UPI003F490C56